jgi:hypothetical protein
MGNLQQAAGRTGRHREEIAMRSTKFITMFGILVGLCAASASRAQAQCGLAMQHGRSALAPAAVSLATPAAADAGAVHKADAGEATIVGLWDVKFTSDNQVVDEGYDVYHSDGTEILNDTVPPATGNVCLGVYEKSGARSLKLTHPSWIFDATNTTVIGRAIILENVTLDKGGRTFSGTFTVQLRDLFGNPLGPDITGQLHGDRVTPQ